MDPDELMDLAVVATQGAFARVVTYTPRDGAPLELLGDFQSEETTLDTAPPTKTTVPVLDLRRADLIAAGLTPIAREGTRPGDTVSFSVFSQVQTYEVLEVEERSPWSTVLVLGRKGE